MLLAIALGAQLAAAGPMPAPDGSPRNGVEYSAIGMLQDSATLTVDFDAATAVWSSTVGKGPNAAPAVKRRSLTPDEIASLRALAVKALDSGMETKACEKGHGDRRRPQLPSVDGFVSMSVRADGRSGEAPDQSKCWTHSARDLQAAAYQAATSEP
jgi:hypothetical protein